MNLRAVAITCAASACLGVVAHAQARGQTVNPEAIEFDAARSSDPDVVAYRVELFDAAADTARATPVRSTDIDARTMVPGRPLRVTIGTVAANVPNGQYVMTIRAVGSTVSVPRATSDPFVLARPEADPINAERERFWTRVGLAIGAGVLLLPFILR